MDEIRVELESAVGPRVLVHGDHDESVVESAIPAGWSVDWATPAARTDGGGWSHPLTPPSGWVPTHRLTLHHHDGCREVELVAVVDGAAYTAAEWAADAAADWELTEEGWLFQGGAPAHVASYEVGAL